MEHQRYRGMIVLGVLLIGLVGLLLPMGGTNAATVALSGELSVHFYNDRVAISHNERWVAFLAKSNPLQPHYNIYLVDTTIVPYSPLQLPITSLENGSLGFSPQDRFLVIRRALSSVRWELYVYDMTNATSYLIVDQPEYPGLTITPDERYILLERFNGDVIYSVPITGGEAIPLVPDDFPTSADYTLFFYTPTQDSRHVLMQVFPYSGTTDSAIAYAPITGTGATIWRSATEDAIKSVVNDAGTIAYVSANGRNGSDTLFRISLTTSLTTPLLTDGQISHFGKADPLFAYLSYLGNDSVSTLYRLNLKDDSLLSLFTTTNVIREVIPHPETQRLIIGTALGNQNIVYGLQYQPPLTATPLITVAIGSPPRDYLNTFFFTPDGNQIVVGERVNTFESHLYSVPFHGNKAPIPLFDGNTVIPYFLPTVDNQAVWAVVRRNGFDSIRYIPLDGTSSLTTFAPSDPNRIILQDTIGQSQVLSHYFGTESGKISLYLTDPRPSITIESTYTALEEGMITPITVTILPSTTVPITVTLDMTGTASMQDIEMGNTVIVVPPNNTQVVTTLRVIVDGQQEPPETLYLTVSAMGDVVIAPPETIAFTLVDHLQRRYLPLIRYFD